MTKQFLTINRQFLDENNYEQTTKHALSLNSKYVQLCELFRKEFQALANDDWKLSSLQHKPIQAEGSRKRFKFIEELKVFIGEFMGILKEQAGYQVGCLQILKDSNHPNLEIASRLVSKVKKNQELCNQIEDKRNVLVQIYGEVKEEYRQFQKESSNPVVYFQPKLILTYQEELKNKMHKDWKIMSEILAKREEYENRIDEFQPYLSTYRKKLISNKYQVLKKIIELITNTKTAIVEMFDTLRNCSMDKQKDYIKIIQSKEDDINYLTNYFQEVTQPSFLEHYTVQNTNWEKYTSQSISEFELAFEDLEETVAQLISFFNNFCNKCNELQLSFRNLINQISQFFPESESPYPLMKELLQVQIHFGRKMGTIVLKLQETQNKLRLQKNSCKKQAQILLTIIKVNKNNYKSFLENFNKNEQLQDLISKISFQPTKLNLITLYDGFIDFHHQLLSQFKTEPRRPIPDSMDISHTLTLFKTPEKKIPLKQEYWLWKKHKSQIEINFQYINQYFKDIEQTFEKIIANAGVKDSTLLEKHAGILMQEKELVGELQLKVNSLDFEAKDMVICIPWKQIVSVSVNSKVWKDILRIETPRGTIQFDKVNNIETVVSEIKETQEKSLVSKSKKIERKPQPQISQTDIATIAARKISIEKELPNLRDFRVIASETFQNYRIDEIYQLFYSDKGFNFYGKEEPCFFTYTGKKAGNYNWIAQQYDHSGPYFYSRNPEVTFDNCHLFSSRKITYNHPMKPSAIPFMPKFCLNSDIRKMYWISHQELLYLIESKTEGAPYADCFEVVIAHSIKAQGRGVNISISMYIRWLESTMMQSTIEANVNPEVEENMHSFLGEVGKVLKLMTSLEKGEEVEIPQEQADLEKDLKKPPDEVSTLKLHNKMLIIAFLGLILLNLVFVVFK